MIGAAPAPERFSRRDILLLLLLGGLIALFFWRVLTPNPNDRAQFPTGDFTDQFYAFRLYEARSLAAGRLPLWSENFNSGHPFLADIQAAVLYPIGLANTLVSVALFGPNFPLFALELEALLHFWLVGAFTFIFARRVIGTRSGAFTAALVFTFGGYLTSYPPLQLAILETATWLPLALYLVDQATVHMASSPGGHARRVVPAALVYLGMVLGIAALAGHPQTFFFVLVLCIAYFLYRTWSTNERATMQVSLTRQVVPVLVMLVIAAGLAAAQWIPSFEYQRLSTREALSFREAAAGLPTLDLLQFIFPGFVSAFASPLYVGILSLWLAILAVGSRQGVRIFWALIALGALILALGFYVFGYALLYLLLPGASLFRDQERLALVTSFALALLAGGGLSDLVSTFSERARKLARRLFGLLPAGLVLSFMLLLTFFVAGVGQSNARQAFLGDRAGLMLLLFGLSSVLVGAYLKGFVTPRVFVGLTWALIVFDLFSVNEPANKAAVTERYPPDPLIHRVQQDSDIFRVVDQGQLPGHFGIAYNLEEIGGISPLRLMRYQQLLTLGPEKAWPLLNVKYQFAAQDGNTSLVQLNNTLPRAWLVGAASVESDDARALARLEARDFDPRQAAVLAAPPPFAPDSRAGSGTLTIDGRGPEWMSLTVDTPTDGLLIVSENFYPGWIAHVDGAATDIARADVSLRAVLLRAGAHRVEFNFDPLSVKVGIAISIITLVICLLSVIVLRKSDKRLPGT